jgi:hypothetical protein
MAVKEKVLDSFLSDNDLLKIQKLTENREKIKSYMRLYREDNKNLIKEQRKKVP